MKRIINTAKRFLKEGLSPGRVAIAIAVGMTFGIFPIYGPISLLCLATAWIARINAPILLAGYYSMTLVKPVLIIPFLRLGEFLFRSEPMPISLLELTKRFSQDALGTLQEFGWSFLHAFTGWLVAAPLLIGLIYTVCMLNMSWRSSTGGSLVHVHGAGPGNLEVQR